MKKTVCILLVLILTLSMAACGSVSKKSDDAPKINFEEVTVVDNDQCVIKLTGIDPDSIWGFSINAYVENKSQDTSYMFSVDSASINGVQSDPLFAVEVAPGKKANEEISFSDSTLEEVLELYTDISLNFQVSDSSDWLADPVAEASVHVYPYGEDKATVYTRKTLETDTVVLDNEHVFASIIGYEYDEIWGYTAKVYLVNKTDTEVVFSSTDVYVNDFVCDPYFATSVSAGNCAFSSISWSDETFADSGVDQVEKIEMTMRAYDNNDWLAEDFARETVTLNP